MSLYERIIAPENIYAAIYSLESFIFERYLLNDKDFKVYMQLHDKFNDKFIDRYVKKCIKRIELIMKSNHLFDCEVYLKAKSYDKKNQKVEFRPIHSAPLLDQICMVSMLSVLMFDDSSGIRKLSPISRLLPANFYGNIPSKNVKELFKPWNKQYKEYSNDTISANRTYYENKKYKYELTLDLKRFFPSINPVFIFNYILEKWPVNASHDDRKWVAIILEKLLFFNIKLDEVLKSYYYPDNFENVKGLNYNIGIAQGLPQAYFFGNICMTIIAKYEKKLFKGDSYYYVDDSIIYTSKEVKTDLIEKLSAQIRYEVNKYIDSKALQNTSLKMFHRMVENGYNLIIHPLGGGKSECRQIEKIDSLYFLAKPASILPFEIRTAQDEFEDITLRGKIDAILKAIDLLIGKAKAQENMVELKRLNRYRKFYLNRLNYLKLSQTENLFYDNVKVDEFIDEFIDKFEIKAPPSESNFFNLLENEVFSFESQSIAEQVANEKELSDKFINAVEAFEFSCINTSYKSDKKNQLYFSKTLSTICKLDLIPTNRYNSLINNKITKGLSDQKRLKTTTKINYIKEIIESIN